MAKINNSNYHHSLEETIHVLGAILKVLMQNRIENRIEIGNIGTAIRSIQAALAAGAKKKQRTEREERIQKKKPIQLEQSENDAETEV